MFIEVYWLAWDNSRGPWRLDIQCLAAGYLHALSAGHKQNFDTHPYHLTIDGPTFRQQRKLLQRLRGFAAAKMPYWPAPGEAELLEGLIGLTDELTDQAHDVHGIDCLLDAGKADP